MKIGKLINSRRTVLGLTLEEVGNAVGVSKSTVKKWEDGFISNMRRDKIAKLATVLQLDPVAFITDESELESEINLKMISDLFPDDDGTAQKLLSAIKKMSQEERKQLLGFSDYLISLKLKDDQ